MGIVKFLGIAVMGLLLGTWGAAFLSMQPAIQDPRYAGPFLSAASDKALRESCFDCHSNEAHYPSYFYAPGVMQFIVRDVVKGRKELNFSEWNTMGPNRKARKLKEMKEQVETGEMPPLIYSLAHPNAKLSDPAKQRLLSDVSAAIAAGPRVEPAKSEAEEYGETPEREAPKAKRR